MIKKPSAYFSQHSVDELSQRLNKLLCKCGIYYRIFARYKTDESAIEKIKRKRYSRETGYLMQDYIGIRIALYYLDDIEICKEIICKHFKVIDVSVTNHDSATFLPERLNLVCEIPHETLRSIDKSLWAEFPIDQTFEIQIRTIFSEGWHEIEHDIRYKSETNWDEHADLSRNLNGLLATLETCDWAIVAIIGDLAHREYKEKKWPNMIKNKFRIHLQNGEINENIRAILNDDSDFAKSLFRCDRKDFILYLSSMQATLPLNANNIIYLHNYLYAHNPRVAKVTPEAFYKLVSLGSST